MDRLGVEGCSISCEVNPMHKTYGRNSTCCFLLFPLFSLLGKIHIAAVMSHVQDDRSTST